MAEKHQLKARDLIIATQAPGETSPTFTRLTGLISSDQESGKAGGNYYVTTPEGKEIVISAANVKGVLALGHRLGMADGDSYVKTMTASNEQLEAFFKKFNLSPNAMKEALDLATKKPDPLKGYEIRRADGVKTFAYADPNSGVIDKVKDVLTHPGEAATDVLEKVIVAGRSALGDKNAVEHVAQMRREGKLAPPPPEVIFNPIARVEYMIKNRPSLHLDATQASPPPNAAPGQNQQHQQGGH